MSPSRRAPFGAALFASLTLSTLGLACTAEEEGQDVDLQQRGTAGKKASAVAGGASGNADADAGAPGNDDHAQGFAANVNHPHRFATAWTSGGGTADLSVDLQADAQDALDGAGLGEAMLSDPTTGTFPDEDDQHPVIFKRSGVIHDGVPQAYFQRFASVDFAKRP